ncbi:MAG TPA: Xaa-Pro peptidase family protein [Ilumatobacter sp.]|nr:Xaa-Pro peptidase family protein [Ilumatobacter sp.]
MTAAPPTGAFPPIGYVGRLESLRERVADRSLRAMIVTDLTNVRWLTGFTGSSGVVAVLPDRAVLVTDGRYRDRAADELAASGVTCEIVVGFTQPAQHDLLVGALAGIDRVGAESGSLTHARWTAIAEDLQLEPVTGLVEEGRRRKDAGEIARIAEAARCADAALAEVAPMLGDGLTEADVRMELEYRMRRHGADGPSYDTIVASGPEHAARPHHHASRRTIVDGDTVVIDVGGLVDGYHSDMTRSYVIGEPTTEQQERYDLLLEVQLAGLAAVRAGVAAKDVDAVCRSMLTEAGCLEWFLHSTGHGVGLLIHEDPYENPTSTSTLVAGDVVTVEPGLYRVGFGGFRIEDLVEVTEHGCRPLTSSPKESPCLPSPPTT